MEREMPSAPEERDPSVPPPGSAEDALRRLEQRLDRASEAAERLMAEAAAQAAGAQPENPAETPPAGWQIPEDAPAGIVPDLEPFLAFAQALRDLIPPELQHRLIAALRELLLALRALIDWYLERLERRREQPVEVEDIPIL